MTPFRNLSDIQFDQEVKRRQRITMYKKRIAELTEILESSQATLEVMKELLKKEEGAKNDNTIT